MIALVLLATSSLLVQTSATNWLVQRIDTTADFRGLAVVSDKIAWVGGTQGTVGRTADGGQTWQLLPVPGAEKLDFRDVKAFGDSTAYILSAGPSADSRIYKTTDAGKTWSLQFQNDHKEAFYDAMAFWDEKHGLALSDPVDGRYRLIRTDDGGQHWTVLPTKDMPPARKGEGAFAASGSCLITTGAKDAWFVTGGANVARIFHTADRGQSWSVSDTPIAGDTESAGGFSISFRDATNGIIVGGDYRKPNAKGRTAATTSDGGKTWVLRENQLPFCSGVSWVAGRLIAVGTAGTFESNDDGATWKQLDTANTNSVRFVTAEVGWSVGPKGRIAKFTRK